MSLPGPLTMTSPLRGSDFWSVDDSPVKTECKNSPSPSDIEALPSSLMAHALETSISLKDHCTVNELSTFQSARLMNDLNIPMKPKLPDTEDNTRLENVSLKPQPQQQGNSVNNQVKM